MFEWSFSIVFFFKQKTAYEMRISDWSSDVCSSDLPGSHQQAIFAFSHASADVRFRISAPGGSSEVNGNLPGPKSCDAALSLHALDADLRSDRSGKVPHQPVFVDRRQLSMVHRIPLHLFRDCAPDSPNSGRRHSCRSSGYFLHISRSHQIYGAIFLSDERLLSGLLDGDQQSGL